MQICKRKLDKHKCHEVNPCANASQSLFKCSLVLSSFALSLEIVNKYVIGMIGPVPFIHTKLGALVQHQNKISFPLFVFPVAILLLSWLFIILLDCPYCISHSGVFLCKGHYGFLLLVGFFPLF